MFEDTPRKLETHLTGQDNVLTVNILYFCFGQHLN